MRKLARAGKAKNNANLAGVGYRHLNYKVFGETEMITLYPHAAPVIATQRKKNVGKIYVMLANVIQEN